MRSLKLTPVNLLWMSRFWSCYTITFVILAFSIAHLEIFPTLHPDLFSPKGLIHRLFSIYLIFNFFLNFFLLHVNHSFVPPPLLTTYIHESDGCSSDNITIEKRINFSIHPPPPSSSSSSSSLEDTFCRVCYIHKPPRCHHCVICNRLVWCGVVWSGVVWCGVVWCGVVWCGVVWLVSVVWCGVMWCGVVGVVDVVWCG